MSGGIIENDTSNTSGTNNNINNNLQHVHQQHPLSPNQRRRHRSSNTSFSSSSSSAVVTSPYSQFYTRIERNKLYSNNHHGQQLPVLPLTNNHNHNNNMAVIPIHNPQDPEACEVKHESKYAKKQHPVTSRTLILYWRNQAKSTVGNLSAFLIGVLLLALSAHRVISLVMTHRRWINAPITYMSRPCPPFEYEKLHDDPGKICITTLTDQKSPSYFQRFIRWRNFDGILDLTWPNKLQYAQKYGYHLYDMSHIIDPSRPPAWSKIKAVQYLLRHEQCDWVMWTDADTAIMNSNIKIEDFLPQDKSKDLLVASDKGGGYNSGVFLFRNTEWSYNFLNEWWNMTQFIRPPGLSLSGDNNAMKALLAGMVDFNEHVLSPPRCTFNSFAKFLTLGQSLQVMDHLQEQEWYLDNEHYHKGDFIAHTPGMDNKAECLRLLLQEVR